MPVPAAVAAPPGVPVLPPLTSPSLFGSDAAAATTTTATTTAAAALRSPPPPPLLPPPPVPDPTTPRTICDSFLRAGSILFSVNPDLFSSAIAQLSAQLSLTLVRSNRAPVPVPTVSTVPTATEAAPPQLVPAPRPPSPLPLHIGGTPATATRAPSPQLPQTPQPPPSPHASPAPQQQQGSGPRRTAFRKYVLPGNVAECYQCMECNERRPENSFHTDHMHFGKKPRIRWFCPLCNAYFAVTHRSGHIKSRHPPPPAAAAAVPASPHPTPATVAAAAAAATEDSKIAAAQKRAAESVANLAAVASAAAAAAAAAASATSGTRTPVHTRHASPTGGPYADPESAAAEDPFYLIPPLGPAQKRACVAPLPLPDPASVGAAGTSDSDSAPPATRTSSAVSLFRTTSSGSRGYFDGDSGYNTPSPVTGMRMLLPFPQAPPP